jgi:GT2 family glycosyltransferase
MFTDDDCYLGEDYFQTAHQVFEGEPFSYCSGRILLYDPSDAAYGAQEQDTFEIISPHSFIPPGRFQGANLIVRRQVFDEIGLFDPVSGAGTPFRCEDIDFVARASHADFTGAHVPELVVYHHRGRKPGEDIRSLDAANNYACGAYYAKFLRRGHLSFLRGWLAEKLFLEKTYGPRFQSLFGSSGARSII